ANKKPGAVLSRNWHGCCFSGDWRKNMNLETQRRIGILEGDLAMRKLLQDLLIQEGYGVSTVSAPEELQKTDLNLDVLVASVPMLSADGLTSLNNIRRARPDLGIILIPTNAEMDKARELVGQGVFTLVNRPFQPWELLHRVRRACELSELKRQNEWLRRKENKEPNSEVKSIIEDEPTLDELEKRYIEIILKKTGGRKDKASKLLGINRRTLYRKEREYGWVASYPNQPLSRVAH
ncbi:MAG: helix-turn-helix domain-containing protein, partial [Pseudomonadota bacterium]